MPNSTKRQRVSFQETPMETRSPISHLSGADRAFIRDLIRESEDITSQVIQQSIKTSEESHFEFIKKLITDSEKKILFEIDKKNIIVRNEVNILSNRLDNLEQRSDEHLQIRDEVLELKRKIMKQENSIVSNSLRIIGVPYREKEDLRNIIRNICDNLKIQSPNIENIYRLNKIYKQNTI